MRALNLLKRPALRLLIISLMVSSICQAVAAEGDLERAEQLLTSGNAAEAKALFEQLLESDPESIDAKLGLGRAYFELGMLGEARNAFEIVLTLEGLPPDLLTQVAVLNEAAQRYLETGERLSRFGYGETGLGHYRVNSTRGTRRRDTNSSFVNANLGGGVDYRLDNGYSLNASLDYEFTAFEEDGVRNGSDLTWRFGFSRNMGDARLVGGVRGQNSYRGNGIFRNDYGAFGRYDYNLDEANRISVGATLRRRRYPSGPLEERTRTTATATVGYSHVINDRATTSITAHGGRNFNTERPDGKSDIWGATVDLDFSISEGLSWYTFGWWEKDDYNTDALHFFPNDVDQDIIRRNDTLFEIGSQLIWQFEDDWTLRPELLYIKDRSNATFFNYSSIEVWINLRRDF